MKDIELPPLPESCQNGNQTTDYFGKLFEYTRQDMRSYARAAVEADRAQRAPDGWVLIATDAYEAGFGKGEQAHKTGREVDNPWGDEPGRGAWAIGYAIGKERAALASTPAPAQQSRWTEDSGLVIDFANRVELSCYDQGSAECMAAVQQILDGKDRGDGVANEPWESIRRRLISLVAPAPAQQEPACPRCKGSGEDPEGYFDQSRGPDGDTYDGPCRDCAGTGAAPQPVERKPMTPEQVAETIFEMNGNEPSALFWRDLVSAIERHHGIRE